MGNERKRQNRSWEDEDPSPQTHTQPQIQGGEDGSKSVWFPGWLSGLGMQWYRVDIDVPRLEDEIKIRHSRNQADPCRIVDMGSWRGLDIQPDYVLDVPDPCCGFVAVASFICCIGLWPGKGASTRIRCLDTDHLEAGWKICPIKTPSSFPFMVPMDSSLYIFGALTGVMPLDNFGEVFDPFIGSSELLPPYPDIPERCPVAIIPLPQQKKILLCFTSNSIVLYDVTHKRWLVHHNKPIFRKLDSPPGTTRAVVGDTIYFFSPASRFTAYDFTTKKTYYTKKSQRRCSQLPSLDPEYSAPAFLHLSSNFFCLLWIDAPFDVRDKIMTQYSVLRCTTLNISKCPDAKYLDVSPLRTHTYLFKTACGFTGAVLTRNLVAK